MTVPPFRLRVHEYEENRQDGTRTLVSYTPFLRMGAPSTSGHAGEVCYLQHGYVYGEGGDPYDARDLPAWFADALAALTPQARHDVGFTADRVQWYTGGMPQDNDVSPANGSPWEVPPVGDLPSSSSYPSGFDPEKWVLGFLCPKGHNYEHTGRSRYNRSMKCVDCENWRKRKPPTAARRARAEAPSAAD